MTSSKDHIKLVQPKAKSRQIIFDCIRRMIKLAVRRDINLCAIVFVATDGKIHLDRIGPVTSDEKDKLLEAIEQLHEDVYISL